MSSHLLTEIEAACDHVVVITLGTLIFAGPMAELLAETSEHVDLRPQDPEDSGRLRDMLASAGWVVAAAGITLTLLVAR